MPSNIMPNHLEAVASKHHRRVWGVATGSRASWGGWGVCVCVCIFGAMFGGLGSEHRMVGGEVCLALGESKAWMGFYKQTRECGRLGALGGVFKMRQYEGIAISRLHIFPSSLGFESVSGNFVATMRWRHPTIPLLRRRPKSMSVASRRGLRTKSCTTGRTTLLFALTFPL